MDEKENMHATPFPTYLEKQGRKIIWTQIHACKSNINSIPKVLPPKE
jgi:hypothetical protein